MKIDGGCHCGNIKFIAEVDPENVRLCHCTDCQHLSGTVYRVNVSATKENISFSGGQPKMYIKTAESGTQRAHAFCPECGTPLYSTSITDQKVFGLRIGTIRQRAELKPKMQQWYRSALGWAQDLTKLEPKIETQRARK